MRFRFPSDTNERAFIECLEDNHFEWQYGRKRTEIATGRLPQEIVDVARELGADYDDK